MSKMNEIMDMWLGTCEKEAETVGEPGFPFLKDSQQNYKLSFENWKINGHPDRLPEAHREKQKPLFGESLSMPAFDNPHKIDWHKVKLLKKSGTLIFD